MAADPQALIDALSSPIRREILWLVAERELAAGQIAAAFDVTPATISQHLAVLRSCGLVEMRVDGNFRRYRTRRDRLAGLELLLASPDRWQAASDLPEQGHASVRLGLVVTTSVAVPLAPGVAFASFAESEHYSRWLGVPVSIVDGRFSCTLEWGTRVRGTYDLVVAPTLIAMRWDFDDDNIPVPGGERAAFLRVMPRGTGSFVEVHQFVDDQHEAEFMRAAWSMVLGRFVEGTRAAPLPRSRRPKRREG
jgi:DNA-binding transcriptional ArsR family regulator/uncharacterized protein YndB with AHSA1/START domain